MTGCRKVSERSEMVAIAFQAPFHLRLSSSSPLAFPIIQKFSISISSSNKNVKSRLTLCSAQPRPLQEEVVVVKSAIDNVLRERSVSVVLLAGGQGKRMGVSSSLSFSSQFYSTLLLFVSFLSLSFFIIGYHAKAVSSSFGSTHCFV